MTVNTHAVEMESRIQFIWNSLTVSLNWKTFSIPGISRFYGRQWNGLIKAQRLDGKKVYYFDSTYKHHVVMCEDFEHTGHDESAPAWTRQSLLKASFELNGETYYFMTIQDNQVDTHRIQTGDTVKRLM
jgi:hypothetical protein